MSINAILYTPGGKYWAMTERGAASIHRSAKDLAIGRSALSLAGDRLVIDIDEWTVPLPRRLRGRVTVDLGPMFGQTYALDDQNRHSWQPIAPCATATVTFENPATIWRGKAYVDMNTGSEPLETAFRSWNWSRAEFGKATRILYDTQPRTGDGRALALEYRCDGTSGTFKPSPLQALRRTGWGIARATRPLQDGAARVLRTLEDTPFYSRSMIVSGNDFNPSRSIHESVDLDRFASRWVQTLLPFKMPRRAR